jgi:O-acetyl-ADP-ribose deacetylase (regulator of RNase III)
VTPRIVESTGSIFESGCAALVSPVDAATGAQGKGLALEFKRRWPERCAEYRRMARSGCVNAGSVYTQRSSDPIILFAATKGHWREPSYITHVRLCLCRIIDAVAEYNIRDIALPALGCGLGGLSWSVVREDILCAAARMQCQRVVIYGPK